MAAVRAFGDSTLKGKLKQPSINLEAAKTAMKASRIYKAILREAEIETSPFAGSRRIGQETIDDFIRMQAVASKDDKPLNKALAALIANCLADDAPALKVVTERRSIPGSGLQPDIQIELRDGEYICIEPTWRNSGKGLDSEIKEAQNTLSEAHVKKYMLDKATQYVKDFGL
ncbi:hypothetical protein DYI37_19615 [Fulvimarina endophytica]|uniref:Uncharacterized protein n=1 Tax=Fulvimarina endophytica TaxID=2293836 RepID=A0A371WXP3_9HYPH|nr:hypothetical protein DYI37_19615 [Fulvimarina endophytica]